VLYDERGKDEAREKLEKLEQETRSILQQEKEKA